MLGRTATGTYRRPLGRMATGTYLPDVDAMQDDSGEEGGEATPPPPPQQQQQQQLQGLRQWQTADADVDGK